MKEVADLFRSGAIKQTSHVRTYDIAELEQGLLQFSKGTHIGKMVVTFDDPEAKLKVCLVLVAIFTIANHAIIRLLQFLARLSLTQMRLTSLLVV